MLVTNQIPAETRHYNLLFETDGGWRLSNSLSMG